jgi:RimJ/RimL family protein N-acetyltransferase
MPNPLLVNFPLPIRTPRLLLKPRYEGEGTILHQAVEESFAHLEPWMVWVHGERGIERAEEVCRKSIADFASRTNFDLSIYDPGGVTFLGSTGLHRPNWSVPAFEIGFWIHAAHVGRGYATEAANALTQYCFGALGARRVLMTCDSRNDKSFAVMKRLGFAQEGLLRNEARGVHGELRDTIVCARVNLDGLPYLEVSWGQ